MMVVAFRYRTELNLKLHDYVSLGEAEQGLPSTIKEEFCRLPFLMNLLSEASNKSRDDQVLMSAVRKLEERVIKHKKSSHVELVSRCLVSEAGSQLPCTLSDPASVKDHVGKVKRLRENEEETNVERRKWIKTESSCTSSILTDCVDEAMVRRVVNEITTLVSRIETRSEESSFDRMLEENILLHQSEAGYSTCGKLCDLISYIVALLWQTPDFRHSEVATGLCRTGSEVVPATVSSIGANLPSSIPCLVRGCVRTLPPSHSTESVAKQCVMEIATLSQIESLRIQDVGYLAGHDDLGLQLVACGHDTVAMCDFLQTVSLSSSSFRYEALRKVALSLHDCLSGLVVMQRNWAVTNAIALSLTLLESTAPKMEFSKGDSLLICLESWIELAEQTSNSSFEGIFLLVVVLSTQCPLSEEVVFKSMLTRLVRLRRQSDSLDKLLTTFYEQTSKREFEHNRCALSHGGILAVIRNLGKMRVPLLNFCCKSVSVEDSLFPVMMDYAPAGSASVPDERCEETISNWCLGTEDTTRLLRLASTTRFFRILAQSHAQNAKSGLPIISHTHLVSMGKRVMFELPMDDALAKYLLSVLYCLEFSALNKISPFQVNLTDLSLSHLLVFLAALSDGDVHSYLRQRLFLLIQSKFSEADVFGLAQYVASSSRHVLSGEYLQDIHSAGSCQVLRKEQDFMSLASCFAVTDYCRSRFRSHTSFPCVCEDPLVLLRSPVTSAPSELRVLGHAMVVALRVNNHQLFSSNTAETHAELIICRDVILSRCLSVTCAVGRRNGSFALGILRSVYARGTGTTSLLARQQMPFAWTDSLLCFIPESVEDAKTQFPKAYHDVMAPAPARLLIDECVANILILLGHRFASRANCALRVALSSLIGVFPVVLGQIGVPVSALIDEDGKCMVAEEVFASIRRLLHLLTNIRKHRQSVNVNELASTLVKLSTQCKNYGYSKKLNRLNDLISETAAFSGL